MIKESVDTNIHTIGSKNFARISQHRVYTHTDDIDREDIEELLTAQYNKIATYHNSRLIAKGLPAVHILWEGRAIDNVCRNLLLTKSVIEN
jgi:hypothetical protein